MKNSSKILTIIFIVIILSLIFLIFKNYLFEEENSLPEETDNFLNGEFSAPTNAADLKKDLIKEELKGSNIRLPEKIAAVEEIRDPFFPSQNSEYSSNIEEGSLLYTESELKVNNQVQASKINNNKSEKKQTVEQKEVEKESLSRNVIEIEIPFSLLGIIKDSSSAAALFSYQGSVIKKTEGENIEKFQIEKIKEEMVVLAYQDFKYNQYIWRHDQIEEK